jgi:ubiquinone/menaquinone biosynthesis C-methylase UbiE
MGEPDATVPDPGPLAVASGATADFGVDAPGAVLACGALAGMALLLAIFTGSADAPWIGAVFGLVAIGFGATTGAMVYSSKAGKRTVWRTLLDELDLRGDERALDVGCGRGLVLIELARRLPRGQVTGVDVWRSRDQSGNTRSVTLANAVVEGVADRVDVRDGDARSLPCADAAFDLVTAGLTFHNIADAQGRAAALAEVARVLRPGGRVAIVDIARTKEYETELRQLGFANVQRSGVRLPIWPPARSVTARKPEESS